MQEYFVFPLFEKLFLKLKSKHSWQTAESVEDLKTIYHTTLRLIQQEENKAINYTTTITKAYYAFLYTILRNYKYQQNLYSLDKSEKALKDASHYIDKMVYRNHDYHTREDIVQEVLYVLIAKIDEVEKPESLSTWLRLYLQNAIRKVTKGQIDILKPEIYLKSHAIQEHTNNVTLINNRIKLLLNQEDVDIWKLYTEGYEYQEIATTLGIKAGAVGTRLYRIRKKLRDDPELQLFSDETY